ncbi:hypothetical protein QR502_07595 [Bifidobacterium catenulatum]|nr:hypothetical protein QR502_07595 [Bifidobacterium catenulatum]
MGMWSATKARIKPGDVCVVTGSGTVGMLTASCALAGGASKVLISDVSAIKLAIAAQIPGIIPVDLTKEDLVERVREETGVGVLMWLSSARARRSHTRHSGS